MIDLNSWSQSRMLILLCTLLSAFPWTCSIKLLLRFWYKLYFFVANPTFNSNFHSLKDKLRFASGIYNFKFCFEFNWFYIFILTRQLIFDNTIAGVSDCLKNLSSRLVSRTWPVKSSQSLPMLLWLMPTETRFVFLMQFF